MEVSQVTVCVLLTVQTVLTSGLVTGGAYTSRATWMGVANADATRAVSTEMGSVNFMMRSVD